MTTRIQRERPIIFSGPMVCAILDGRKSMTRRVAKIVAVMGNRVPVTSPDESLIELEEGEFSRGIFHYLSAGALSGPYKLPYAVGDMLWVREAFATDGTIVRYAATDDIHELRKTKSPIHMPRWASRITLQVTAVKVERLQDISEKDARAEGVTATYPLTSNDTAKKEFADLWQSIHGPGSWEANPFVAAISFSRANT